MSPPVEIIAEIANAHQGDPVQAEKLALAAVAAGADAVKFQVYFAEELLVERHPRFIHFREQAFGSEVWQRLLRSVQASGARVYCDVFGLKALEVASAAGIKGVKVHSSDLGNRPLLFSLAQRQESVLLSCGGSTANEIAQALKWVLAGAGGRRIRPVLLHGFQSYPTAIEDTQLVRLSWLRELFGGACAIGYMDHVDGDDPLAMALPLLAIGMGARVIEKHITLNRAERGTDYYSSLNPEEFERFVRLVRQAEIAIGASPERFSEAERRYRRQVKKVWVTNRPVKKGETLTEADLSMKRAETPAEAADLDALIGRALLSDRPAEHVVTRADLPQTIWALVVARLRSCRLPGKALVDVAGRPALEHLIERLRQARCLASIVVCTTTESEDDAIAELARRCAVRVFRGASENVLGRMIGALEGAAVDVVLRVTGDDILVDPEYLDRAVEHHLAHNAQYTDAKALPSGTEVEVFDAALLRMLSAAAKDASGTEYLTSYVMHHPDQFRVAHCPVQAEHRREWRLTLDTPEDLQVLRAFLAAMREQGRGLTYRMDDIVRYFSTHAQVLELNAKVRQRQTPPEVCTELAWGAVALSGT